MRCVVEHFSFRGKTSQTALRASLSRQSGDQKSAVLPVQAFQKVPPVILAILYLHLLQNENAMVFILDLTSCIFVQHIVDQPGEAKYRRLREAPLERRLGGLLPHCVQLLQASGFEKMRIDGEAVLLLMEGNSDRLQSVLQAVQHQHNILSR